MELLVELCSFLQTQGEESASRSIRVVGSTGFFVVTELRRCFLAGHFQSQQQHATCHSHSESLRLLPLPHLLAPSRRRFSLLMSSDRVHLAGLPLLISFGQVLGIRERTFFISMMFCLPQLE